MSKGLEALKEIKEKYKDDNGLQRRLSIIEKELIESEKNKKALEIIKAKLPPLMRSALLDYCDKEEYDLLKEVLL